MTPQCRSSAGRATPGGFGVTAVLAASHAPTARTQASRLLSGLGRIVRDEIEGELHRVGLSLRHLSLRLGGKPCADRPFAVGDLLRSRAASSRNFIPSGTEF
jgi:hypothetical protein